MEWLELRRYSAVDDLIDIRVVGDSDDTLDYSMKSMSKSPVPMLRKDFPETWIWNDINDEG